jgi:ribosomal protein S18 acetylase RimI-like enzyme
MSAIWILNDLFVHREHRDRGVGRALLTAAETYGRQKGAAALVLETAESNTLAKKLYEGCG